RCVFDSPRFSVKGGSVMFQTKILGTGSYSPKKILTNQELEKMVETNDAWIVDRTGIRGRAIADASEVTSDLALHASRAALEAAGCTPEELEMIIFATVSPDMVMP